MALTTESGLRVSRSKDITKEDFVDDLDRIAPAETPFMSYMTNEVQLNAVDRNWNIDSLPSPKGGVGRADGEAAPGSGSAQSRDWAGNIKKMSNAAQGFSETYRVGWIAGQVPQVAGMKGSPLSYAKAGALLLIKQHMEVAFCSMDQTAVFDGGVGLGARCAGWRMLTTSANAYAAGTASSFAVGKAPSTFAAPASAVITGAMSAGHNRAMWKTFSKALRTAAKRKTNWTFICGLGIRQAVTDLTDVVLSAASAQGASAVGGATQVRVYMRGEDDSTLGGSVDVIQTDFGRFKVVESDYIGTTLTDSAGSSLTASADSDTGIRASAVFTTLPNAGLIFKEGDVWKTWGITPFSTPIAPDGGSDAVDLKCLATWGIKNPLRSGTTYFTS